MMNLRSKGSRCAVLFCGGLMLALTAVTPLQATLTNTQPWTTIGSAGSVMLGTYSYMNGSAFLASPSGVLRYNVVAVDGLLDTVGGFNPAHIRMTARFRDPDGPSRVTVHLRRTRISDGFTANVAGVSLDSNNYAPGTQTRSTVCASAQLFDFVNYVYYVEVILTRAPNATSPSIDAIQIGWDDGGCISSGQ